MPLATWIASGNYSNDNADSDWPNTLYITGLAASMAVNTLMTGMIAFRIFKVMGAMPSTSVERTLGSTGVNKFRNIMFIIIESGMALFAIQLVRLVLALIPASVFDEPPVITADNFVISINQTLNVIIIISTSFVLLITFTWIGNRTNDNFGAGPNEDVIRWRRILSGGYRKSSF